MSRSVSSFQNDRFSPVPSSSTFNSEEDDYLYVTDGMDSSHSNSPNHNIMMARSLHDECSCYSNPHSGHVRAKNKSEVCFCWNYFMNLVIFRRM